MTKRSSPPLGFLMVFSIIFATLLISGTVISRPKIWAPSQTTPQVQSQTYTSTAKFELEKELFSSTSLGFDSTHNSTYEQSHEFLGDIVSSPFAFSAVGLTWNEFTPAHTSITIEMRFQQQGQWSGWYNIPRDVDHKDDTDTAAAASGLTDSFLAINPANTYQYKVTLSGSGSATPTISNIKVTTIQVNEPQGVPQSTTQGASHSSSHISAEITQDMVPTDRVRIISRSEWGADESIRTYKGTDQTPPLVKLDSDYADKFSDELQIVKKITTNDKGELLSWPLEYAGKISKIIVHHTASMANLDNPKQAIRDIYYWHTIGRVWGDIGYNYVVDPQGNIYEGRFGGEGVVGAHAGKSNTGSIGISVMGNYESSEVPDKVIVSLAHLISEKTKIHGIDPTGKSIFRGQLTSNVLGHRDVMSTSCPGQKLYDKLALIAQLAKSVISTTTEDPQFARQKASGIDYEDHSGLLYISLDPDQEKTYDITIKNSGSVTWSPATSLVVNDFSLLKDFIQVLPPNGGVTFPMNEPRDVHPGESATFKLKLAGGFKSALKTLQLVPIINGKTKLYKYISLSMQTTPAIFTYDVVGQLPLPKAMKAGEKFTAWIDIKNTGNVNWLNTGNKIVRLGTDHPRDKASVLTQPSSPRIANLSQPIVKPGETTRFTIQVRAPSINGTIAQYMTPVVEGLTWMADKNLSISTFIYEKKYAATPIAIARLDALPATTQTVTVKLRNMGGVSWSAVDNTLPLLKKTGAGRSKLISAVMQETSVDPGAIGTFTVTLTTPYAFASDKMRLDAIIAGNKLTLKPITIAIRRLRQQSELFPLPLSSSMSVSTSPSPAPSTTLSPSSGSIVRVHIGFSGIPVISGNGPFSLQSGSTSHTFSANEKVAITTTGTTYQLTSGSFSQSLSSPPRFTPGTTSSATPSILRIDNLQRRPDWDQSLNDNEFRGTLEVRADSTTGTSASVINELPIEDYLKGMAETPNSEPMEKKKAIITAARNYAIYYTTTGKGKKFPGKPYDLDDDPEHTQKYRGYGVEKRSPNSVKSVEDTRGIVIEYLGNIILAPYFSTDTGHTFSAQEAWGWQNTPYLPSVDDPYCKDLPLAGHGVGMSGCGAFGMAKNGSTYDQILKYFYKGVTLEKIY